MSTITPLDLLHHMLTAGTVGEWALFLPLCALLAFVVGSLGAGIVEGLVQEVNLHRARKLAQENRLVTLVAAHVDLADQAFERNLDAKTVSLEGLRGSIVEWLDATHRD
jgi:hypothetical protein